MPTTICNTPAGLIPQELFKEEKIQEYWNVLYPNLYQEFMGIDKLGEFVLLYPKPKDEETTHEITRMYQTMIEKFPQQTNTIGLYIYENSFSMLAVKDRNVVFVGFFYFSADEDIVYHLAHVSHHFFENISQIKFYYQQLSPKMLHLLNNYFEMTQL